jgi:hypothetical protein
MMRETKPKYQAANNAVVATADAVPDLDVRAEMKAILIYTPAVISIICSGLWYLPWLFEPRTTLSYYLIAFFWFLGAWIFLAGLLVLAVRERRKESCSSKSLHCFLSSTAIFGSYLAVFIGAANGFLVTV